MAGVKNLVPRDVGDKGRERSRRTYGGKPRDFDVIDIPVAPAALLPAAILQPIPFHPHADLAHSPADSNWIGPRLPIGINFTSETSNNIEALI